MSQVRRPRNGNANGNRANGNRKSNYRQSNSQKRNSSTTRVRHDTNRWTMKLGAWAHARWREAQYDSVSRKVIQGAIIGFVAIVVFGLATAFGVVERTTNMIAEKSAMATRFVGLSVTNLEVVAFNGHDITAGQKAEVEAIAGVPSDAIMFQVNPQEIRNRILVLPWVEDVMVRRLWPNNLQIVVQPREANAVWQEDGELQYMDSKGQKLGPADPKNVKGLPLVIGFNAGPNSPHLFAEIEKRAEVARHTYAMIRINDRRWNLKLRNGGEVLLPEDNMEKALDTLENLHAKYQILDRDFARLDVRKTGAIIIRPKAEATGESIHNT